MATTELAALQQQNQACGKVLLEALSGLIASGSLLPEAITVCAKPAATATATRPNGTARVGSTPASLRGKP